jgi:hypothetical protein
VAVGSVQRDDPKMRVAVWFDRPKDMLCFADRLDERIEEGAPIPEDLIVRIPLKDAEDFVDALFNYIVSATLEGEDFTKVMYGIQTLLDNRAAYAVELSERLRMEMTKKSQGTVNRNMNEVLVRLDYLTRLRNLRDVVSKQMQRVEEDGLDPAEGFAVIASYFGDKRMLEA